MLNSVVSKQISLGTLLILLCLCSCLYPLSLCHAESDTLYIGLNLSLTGRYADQGREQRQAYELAIKSVNKDGGILGKKIGYHIKDTKTDSDIARANTIELIDTQHVVMVTGGSSDAVAMAQSEVCQNRGVLFMAALTHSKATTGFFKTPIGSMVQTAHRHTFRWYYNDWMAAQALGHYLVKNYGEDAEYFYITADDPSGQSQEESMRWITETMGSNTTGSVLTSTGQSDFKKEFTQAIDLEPDLLVINLSGEEIVQAMRQAHAMGLKKRVKIVVPVIELNTAHEIGSQAMEGIISTVNWYWEVATQYTGSRDFVNLYTAEYKRPPGSAAASAWVAIHEWASAVKVIGRK